MSKNKERLSGKQYEELIFKIYKELEPLADIKKNDKILGLESGAEREIDISIRKKIADINILIIIQAKDHKKRADIKILGEFDSVIRDVRASRGILICNSGFTRTAKDYAKNKGIDLYSAHDASVKDWNTEINIPVIRSHSSISYGVKVPFTITKEIKEKYSETKIQAKMGPEGFIMQTFDGRESSFLKEFTKLWNLNRIDKTDGSHTTAFDAYLDIFADPKLFPKEPAILNYTIKTRHYLKFFVPSDYRGVRNYITDKFKPSFIRIEDSLPFANDRSWRYIENPSELSLDPIRLEIDIVDIQNMQFIKAAFKDP